MSLNNFCYTKLNYTLALQYLNLLHYQLIPYLSLICSQWMEHYLSTKFILYPSMNLLISIWAVIVPLTTIYASLYSHKSDCSIDVLNLICFLMFYGSPDWLWTSTNFLVKKVGTLSDVVSRRLIFFGILFSYYILNNLKSPTFCCFVRDGM